MTSQTTSTSSTTPLARPFISKQPSLRVTIMMKALLICTIASVACGNNTHHTPPSEDNVFSPEYCVTNPDGFGGELTSDVFPLDYNYELELKGDPEDVDSILFALERSIADFLLQTNLFVDACDRRRRAQSVRASHNRRLSAVGITINPPDEPTGLACDTPPSEGNTCTIVAGQLQVYTVGSGISEEGLTNGLKGQLQSAMNNGDFDDADDSIERVTYAGDLAVDRTIEGNRQDPDGINTQSSGGSSTAVIIGASVGAVLILGALAMYRRRYSKAPDDDTFTRPGGSSA